MIKFISFMTGAKGDTLKRAGHTSIQRYLHYALLMFIPLAIWFFGVWKLSDSIVAGVIAMVVVFFFDRSIIANGTSEVFNNGRKVIAIIMGLFISMIIDDIVFRAEINEVLKTETEFVEKFDNNKQVVSLENRIKDQSAEVKKLREHRDNEADGTYGDDGYGENTVNASMDVKNAVNKLDALQIQYDEMSANINEDGFGYLDKFYAFWFYVANPFNGGKNILFFILAIMFFTLGLSFELMPLLFKWHGGSVYYQELIDVEELNDRVTLHQDRVESTFRRVA